MIDHRSFHQSQQNEVPYVSIRAVICCGESAGMIPLCYYKSEENIAVAVFR
jgi:hypothetical protein